MDPRFVRVGLRRPGACATQSGPGLPWTALQPLGGAGLRAQAGAHTGVAVLVAFLLHLPSERILVQQLKHFLLNNFVFFRTTPQSLGEATQRWVDGLTPAGVGFSRESDKGLSRRWLGTLERNPCSGTASGSADWPLSPKLPGLWGPRPSWLNPAALRSVLSPDIRANLPRARVGTDSVPVECCFSGFSVLFRF